MRQILGSVTDTLIVQLTPLAGHAMDEPGQRGSRR
jgi:hypothetical protein